MRTRKTLLAAALMLALALGVWGVAVSFTAFNFSDGDTLSAAAMNDALNTNFSAAEAAITALEARVAALEEANVSLPIAYGFVAVGGTVVHGTGNFDVVYESASNRYRITIEDVSYFINNYYTVASAGGTDSNIVTTSSLGGDLMVYVHDEDGNPDASAAFNFVTFKKP